MDTITVVMTGLMLLTPDHPNGRGPTHVLMPAAEGLPHHVTLLAYQGDRKAHCSYYGHSICVVDMSGWWMEVGTRNSAAAGRIPAEAASVTHASGKRRVRKRYLDPSPGRRVSSRLTLRGANTATQCSLGRWDFDTAGDAAPETVSLANVVTWKITDYPHDRLELVRHRLDRKSGDQPELLETLGVDSRNLELLIMHVPIDEAQAFIDDLLAPAPAPNHDGAAGRRLPADRGGDRIAAPQASRDREEPKDGFLAHHFKAYYGLLDKPIRQPLPQYRRLPAREDEPSCSLPLRMLAGRAFRGAGTYSCMVASALPDS